MADSRKFPNLQAAGRELGSRTDGLTLSELRQLLCHDCDFFTDDHDDDLECSCFQILRLVIERGYLTPAGLAAAVRPEGQDREEPGEGKK